MIRLQQRPLLGLLVNPLGSTARALEVEGEHLRVVRRGRSELLPLGALTEPPSVRKGALGSTVIVPSSINGNAVLRAAQHAEALAFSRDVKAAWANFNLAALQREAERFDRIFTAVVALSEPTRYPAACTLTALLDEARALETAYGFTDGRAIDAELAGELGLGWQQVARREAALPVARKFPRRPA
jgi:DNA helicase-4